MIVEIAAGFVALLFVALMWLKTKLPKVNNYSKELAFHSKFFNQDWDADKDVAEFREAREKAYLELTENYYTLTTDLFHVIWGPHYSMGNPFPREGGVYQDYAASQQMYQCYIGLSLGANEDTVIGDFGCGCGGPARCIAQFTGTKIKCVNITKKHLEMAAEYNKEFGLEHKIDLVHTDFHETPFEDESLDGVFFCESLGHSPDYPRLMKEVFRVLKPGAKLTGFNWELTDNFDESNPKHRHIRFCLGQGLAVAHFHTMQDLRDAMKEAGFEVLISRDHSDFTVGLGSKPWYFVMEDTKTLQGVFSTLTTLVWAGLWVLELFKMVNPGTCTIYKNIMICLQQGMVEGYKEKVFTPMHYFLAQKPLKKAE